MRLTADLLSEAPSYINPIKDRELDLRGHKIPAIENLGVSKDQNDAIDFTDNDIRHLGNFPRLVRVRTLLLARNRISSISSSIASSIPNLQTLVLNSNALVELADLDPLAELPKLQVLSLLDNPVSRQQYYRHWVIWRCRHVRILDFKKVKQKVADEMFGTSIDDPTPLAAQIAGLKSKMFDVNGVETNGQTGAGLTRISEEERKRIHEAIRNATSMAEVQRLEMLLAEGRIPGKAVQKDSEMQG